MFLIIIIFLSALIPVDFAILAPVQCIEISQILYQIADAAKSLVYRIIFQQSKKYFVRPNYFKIMKKNI